MQSNQNRNYMPIIGSDYFLHLKRVGDKQTAHEKMLNYLYEKQGLEVNTPATDGITGMYLCTLNKETLNDNGKYVYPEVTSTLFVPTDTLLETDKYGNFLLKSYLPYRHSSWILSKAVPQKKPWVWAAT